MISLILLGTILSLGTSFAGNVFIYKQVSMIRYKMEQNRWKKQNSEKAEIQEEYSEEQEMKQKKEEEIKRKQRKSRETNKLRVGEDTKADIYYMMKVEEKKQEQEQASYTIKKNGKIIKERNHFDKGFIELKENQVLSTTPNIKLIPYEELVMSNDATHHEGGYVVGKNIAPGVYQVDSDYPIYLDVIFDLTQEDSVEHVSSYMVCPNEYIELKENNAFCFSGKSLAKVDEARYEEPLYKVGENLAPGSYYLKIKDKEHYATFSQYNSQSLDRKITQELFFSKDGQDTQIVTVKEGEYLFSENTTLHPLSEAPFYDFSTKTGSFLVGKTIEPGWYSGKVSNNISENEVAKVSILYSNYNQQDSYIHAGDATLFYLGPSAIVNLKNTELVKEKITYNQQPYKKWAENFIAENLEKNVNGIIAEMKQHQLTKVYNDNDDKITSDDKNFPQLSDTSKKKYQDFFALSPKIKRLYLTEDRLVVYVSLNQEKDHVENLQSFEYHYTDEKIRTSKIFQLSDTYPNWYISYKMTN